VGEDKTPAYVQIVNAISERVASGEYDSGSRLPSESQFCAEFGVSPMTLRRALLILADRGLIVTERGRGTFVRSFGLSDSVFTLEQLTGQLADGASDVRLLSASTVKAGDGLATMLDVNPHSRVVVLRSLLTREKTPAVYHTEYVIFDPRRPLVESQLQITALHGLLQSGRGRSFPRGEVTLSALSLDADSAEILAVPAGTSALCLEHLFRDAARRPMSWGRFLLRSDLFRLRASLGPE
jgi:GntR family transcriptional regulator